MFRRAWSYVAVGLVALVVGSMWQPFTALSTLAQRSCRTFPETGKSVCGSFLQYWNTHGALAQQGFPISNEFTEVSDLNGKSYTVQYFERAVFEKHPENQPPYDVLLSQLGTFQFKARYPNGEPGAGGPPPAPTAAPAPPNIMGQHIVFPGGSGGQFRAEVTNVKEAKSIPPAGGGDGGTAHGKFVIVYLTVTNIGNVAQAPWDSTIKLKDSQGRIFDATDDFEVAYAAYKATPNSVWYGDKLNPGVPTPVVYVYDVPTDASLYYLTAGAQ